MLPSRKTTTHGAARANPSCVRDPCPCGARLDVRFPPFWSLNCCNHWLPSARVSRPHEPAGADPGGGCSSSRGSGHLSSHTECSPQPLVPSANLACLMGTPGQ
ncbi:hypothetical protein LIA77_03379 [Sarocladium implicatum]|nr:hypothetical protein LIA77_03379 [Sarocladium implicatum]